MPETYNKNNLCHLFKYLLIVFLFPLPGFSHFFCAQSLIPPIIHQGKLAKETENTQLFFLGEGVIGGRVYRVVPKKNQSASFLEKHYFHPRDMEQEQLAWKFLRKHSKNGKILGYEMVHYIKTENSLIYRSNKDFKGIDLYHYLHSSSISDFYKEEVFKEYRLLIDIFYQYFQDLSQEDSEILAVSKGSIYGGPALQIDVVSNRQAMKTFRIFIHTKNVLVTSEGLVLIDPN